MKRRDFINFAVAMGFGAAAGFPRLAFADNAFTPTYKRYRPKLIDLTQNQQKKLFGAIKTYANNNNIIKQHSLDNGAHGLGADRDQFGIQHEGFGVGEGRGRNFFHWHRNYLKGLEASLPADVKLATWAPWETIPTIFKDPGSETGNVRQPNISADEFRLWCHELIAFWCGEDGMGVCLSFGVHFKTHIRTGGDMAEVPKAPKAPIFWTWHAFIDDLYQDWLDQTAALRRKSCDDYQPPPPPKSLPFPSPKTPWGNTPPPNGPKPGDYTTTPFVLGMQQRHAKTFITDAGLSVGSESDFPNDRALVTHQDPPPFTPLKRGQGRVDISGKLDAAEPPIEWDPPPAPSFGGMGMGM